MTKHNITACFWSAVISVLLSSCHSVDPGSRGQPVATANDVDEGAEIDPAVRLLTILQREAYAKEPWARSILDAPRPTAAPHSEFETTLRSGGFGPVAPENVGPAIEEVNAELRREAVESLPTRLQEPLSYLLLHRSMDLIESTPAGERLKGMRHLPLLGTLPYPSLDADVRYVPETGGHIILVDSYLFILCTRLFRISCSTMEWKVGADGSLDVDYSINAFRRSLDANPRLMSEYRSLVLDVIKPGAYSGRLGQPSRYPLAEAVLHVGARAFVVGHECGHVLNGDVPPSSLKVPLTNPEDFASDNMEKLIESWRHEILADGIGFKIVEQAGQATVRKSGDAGNFVTTPEFAESAALVYFITCEHVEDARYIIQNRRYPDQASDAVRKQAMYIMRKALKMTPPNESVTYGFSDHPPYWLRKEYLSGQLLRGGAVNSSRAKEAIAVAQAMVRNLSAIWAVERNHLLDEAVEKGVGLGTTSTSH